MQVAGPTVVRRQLGRRLRQIRLDQHKTIEDVTSTKTISKATLHRYEGGRDPQTPNVVLGLCLVYELDTSTTRELHDLAVGSQAQGWWESGGEVLKSGFRFYIGLESAADGIHVYNPNVVPGQLQTADYVRALSLADISAPDAQTINDLVEFRMKRQQMLLERAPAIDFRFVLGPAVLATEVGGPDVMAAQVAHIRTLTKGKKVQVRVLSAKSGAHAAVAGGFTIMTYNDTDDPEVAYVESAAGGAYYELPAQVQRYARIFDSVFAQSTPIEEYQP